MRLKPFSSCVAAGVLAAAGLAAPATASAQAGPPGAPMSLRPASGSLASARAARAEAPPVKADTPAAVPVGAAEKGSKAAPDAAAAGAAPATPPAAPEDPMDRLRRRLAERLAAEDARSNPNVLRVVTRPSVPEPVPGVLQPRPRTRVAAQGSGAANKKGATQASRQAHWAYEGEAGPGRWAELHPEFAACGKGARQSPIDVRDSIGVQLDPVLFDYRPSSFKVIDNGHTVQVNVAPGNSIEVMGRRYELVQFHFHRPSEERINGRQHDMSAHLVHKDAEGRLAVVAVLLDRGSPQPVVQTIWNNLPLEKHEEVPARVEIDLNALLPAERGYYTYMGSMTTPPCNEGVLWMVMKQPVGVAPDQIGVFSRLYPMNARPVQASAGRLIKGSK